MSDTVLFMFGVVASGMTLGALTLLAYASMLDGKPEAIATAENPGAMDLPRRRPMDAGSA